VTNDDLLQKLTEAGVAPGGADQAAIDAAVRKFQAAHGLTVDGIVGPKTEAALRSPPSAGGCIAVGWVYDERVITAELLPVLRAARAEIGVREQPPGSNRGPRVDVYTAPLVGIPWCAAFVSWCYAQRAGGSPFGKIFGTRDLLAWAMAHGRTVRAAAIQAGDVFFIPTTPAHGHVGLVAHPACTDPARSSGFSTLEGNSGDAVWGRVRQREQIGAFIRPVG